MANLIDQDQKKTRLNNKYSLWDAITTGLHKYDHADELRGKQCKTPTHVVATQTWSGEFTYAINFGILTNAQHRKRNTRGWIMHLLLSGVDGERSLINYMESSHLMKV